MPLGHRADPTHAGFADRGHRPEAVAIERVERHVEPGVARRAHQEGEVVAPVAGHHGVGTCGLDLGRIRRKVANAAERVKFVADDLHTRPALRQQFARAARHFAAEAVVLVDQVDALRARIVGQYLHQRCHPHLRMGVETEVPRAAALVGQHRIHGRVVEEQLPLAGVALVVAVDRIDQRTGHRRTVALKHEAHALIGSTPQQDERLLDLPLGVVAGHVQRARALWQLHTTASVDPIDRELQVARDSFAGVGKWTRQPLDHAEPDRLDRGRARRAARSHERKQHHCCRPPAEGTPSLPAITRHCKSR